MQKISFYGSIVFVGWGAVARATLVPLVNAIQVDWKQITIVDAIPRQADFPELASKGVRFIVSNVSESNYDEVLSGLLKEGDILIDVAVNINTCTMLDWCAKKGVQFYNTAVYEWDHCGTEFSDFNAYTPLFDETIEEMRKVHDINSEFKKGSATAVISHGANPGLVNHLMKKGIEEIALAVIKEKPDDARVPDLQRFLEESNHSRLAMLLGISVIQVSERDTQKVTFQPKQDQYISTWNIPSFCEELAAPAEFSWGTQETKIPSGSKFNGELPGEKSFISLNTRGHQTRAKSWMPGEGDFTGLVVRHEECFSMANYVSVRDEKTGQLIYRPTVYFVYDQALSQESVQKFVQNDYTLLPESTVVEREIEDGADKLGVLLLGHDFGGWWIGSHLDIHTARRLCAPMESLVGSVGATALQVGASLAASICWGIKNPFAGAHFPETLPTDFILEAAKPWLGQWVSQPHAWVPKGVPGEMVMDWEGVGEEVGEEDLPVPSVYVSSSLISWDKVLDKHRKARVDEGEAEEESPSLEEGEETGTGTESDSEMEARSSSSLFGTPKSRSGSGSRDVLQTAVSHPEFSVSVVSSTEQEGTAEKNVLLS